MPFTFLPHQAAVVPLKIWRPRWFSGTALAIGSMAPDLEYFLRGYPYGEVGHAWLGQLTFSLPLSLALVWLVTHVIARPLAANLPELDGFHLRDYALVAAHPDTAGRWLVIAASALVGSLSHVFWDGFTHEWGWAARRWPTVFWRPLGVVHGYPLSVCNALQHASTVLGGAATIVLLHRIGTRRALPRWMGVPPEQVPAAAPARRRRFWATLATLVALGAVAAAALAGVPRDLTRFREWIPAIFRTVSLSFVALCVACAMWRERSTAE